MSSFEIELPVLTEAFEDESGIGYCLRSLCANGANLYALRRLMSIREDDQITAAHARELSQIFRQSTSWFETALPLIKGKKPYQADYFGHQWFSLNNLRLINPQVCVRCIHYKGYCRAIWDCSMAVACTEHNCMLSDICVQCKKALRWNRPGVDYGHCGHLLKSNPTDEASDVILEFQGFLEKKFRINSVDPQKGIAGYLGVLDHLSLSGIQVVIASFGMRNRPLEALHSSVRVKRYMTHEWVEIMERGLSRLAHWHSGKFEKKELSLLVSDVLLKHMALRHDYLSDQLFAVTLLDELFGISLKSKFGTPFAQLSQIELF